MRRRKIKKKGGDLESVRFCRVFGLYCNLMFYGRSISARGMREGGGGGVRRENTVSRTLFRCVEYICVMKEAVRAGGRGREVEGQVAWDNGRWCSWKRPE